MQSQVFQFAAVVLLAVLIGTIIPFVLELRAAAKTFRTSFECSAKAFNELLVELLKTNAKVKQIADDFGQKHSIAGLVHSAEELSASLEQMNQIVRISSAVGAAVGPAAAAFISVLREKDANSKSQTENVSIDPEKELCGSTEKIFSESSFNA